MTIADRIKQTREEKGLTQTELAKLCGYSDKTSISKIENAGNNITLKKIRRIANALSISHTYLMGWDDPVETFDTSEDFEKHWNAIGGGRHPLHIDDTEYSIIVNYRASDPGTQNAVLKLLDIEKKDADILNA